MGDDDSYQSRFGSPMVQRREEHVSICDHDENQMRGFREAVDVCVVCVI
jgi:hypothetical protein